MKKISLIFSFLFIFVLFFTGLSYAAEITFPEIPTPDDKPIKTYVIYETYSKGPELLLLTSDTNLFLSCYRRSNNPLYFDYLSNNQFDINRYELKNGQWSRTGGQLNADHGSFQVNTANTIYSSTFDIYESDKTTLFFQKTPMTQTPTLEETLEEEIPIMAEKIIQTMKIILLCGVGCLALLISLPIFGKVLSRWVTR